MHSLKMIFVSAHPDYLAVRPRLKPTAVPSIFLWTTQAFQPHSITSQIASSALQRNEYGSNDGHETSHVDELITGEGTSSPSSEIDIQKVHQALQEKSTF